jgi:hypothetical protein
MECNKTTTLFIMGVFLKKKKNAFIVETTHTISRKTNSVSMLTLFLGLKGVESSEEQIV